ncbi:hypothetical protein [Bufonid herpesvirus 1]|uniref:hypothetical protein n=1 Tax=Bufonid herpesvirus 1 TaxID=2282206 RepID=UPI000EB77FC6|nr:hypothetical protein [Bufonid herpesvirus 1]AXF48586.1 hypothetical protein [Bufonid herpesvirus 1]
MSKHSPRTLNKPVCSFPMIIGWLSSTVLYKSSSLPNNCNVSFLTNCACELAVFFLSNNSRLTNVLNHKSASVIFFRAGSDLQRSITVKSDSRSTFKLMLSIFNSLHSVEGDFNLKCSNPVIALVSTNHDSF